MCSVLGVLECRFGRASRPISIARLTGLLSEERPLADAFDQAQQITVRILHQELQVAGLDFAGAIPSFLARHEERPTRLFEPARNRPYRINTNLEIDAAAERRVERAGRPLARFLVALLQHELDAVKIEISESLFRSMVEYRKADQIAPKTQARLEIATRSSGARLFHEGMYSRAVSCHRSMRAPLGG
jgi:hypothetical protein